MSGRRCREIAERQSRTKPNPCIHVHPTRSYDACRSGDGSFLSGHTRTLPGLSADKACRSVLRVAVACSCTLWCVPFLVALTLTTYAGWKISDSDPVCCRSCLSQGRRWPPRRWLLSLNRVMMATRRWPRSRCVKKW